MNDLYYTVSADLFQRFPGYVRGVVIARDVTNRPSPEDLIRMLREVEESVRGRRDIQNVAEHPRLKSWREAQ